MIHAFLWGLGRQLGAWAAGMVMAGIAFWTLKAAARSVVRRFYNRGGNR